ncbi:MAG TPA: DUF1592 domain-containing protein [Polyangia bacterium]|nr:DUF1592 domain-containing protein [Polyangia bacterium]
MRSSALGLVLVAAAGCSGQIGAPGIAGGGPPGAQGLGGAGGAGSMNPGMVTPVCTTESPSPRLLRQLTRAEYGATVADLLGIKDPNINDIPPDNLNRGFTNNVTVSFVTETHMDAYSSVGAQLASRAVAESLSTLVTCTTQDAACAADFVDKFGTRAFRRLLTADEKSRYVKLFDPMLTGGVFKTGVELTIRSMLVSPNFLFRSELGIDKGQGIYVLTPYEIASALSYNYWGTMPDDALFAAAKSGALANKSEIEAQARRLLMDARGRARIADFFYYWMEAPKAYFATKDPATFPDLFKTPGQIDTVRDAMRAEQDAFVTNVVFDSTKKFGELFTADYTFANDLLAGFYGVPAPGSATAVKKVALPASSMRGGLLTMGLFLFGHARTTASSPTQRGHIVREGILCDDVPPPPPGVDPTIPEGTPGKTARDQITYVTSASNICQSCHTLMDPIGFGLENFDSVGEFRTTDNGQPVDATGNVKGMTTASGGPVNFNGPRELSSIISASPQAQGCLATNYYRYARGFDAQGVDSCAVNILKQTFTKGDIDLPTFFVQLALQDSFITRRSAEVLEK